MIKRVLMIHGAGATPACWKYITNEIGSKNVIVYVHFYDIKTQNLTEINNKLYSTFKDVKNLTIIGHSLGGIIGFNLATMGLDVKNLITISSPFDGLNLNLFIKSILMLKVPNLSDIFKGSIFLKNLARKKIDCNWVMVKTKNSGFGVFFNEENDGVLSYRDQLGRNFHQKRLEIDLEHSHLEVLLSDKVVDIIKEVI